MFFKKNFQRLRLQVFHSIRLLENGIITSKGLTKQPNSSYDPETGETSREEQQTLDKDEQNAAYRESEALDLEGVISIEEASQIALDAVGSGEVTDLDLERELSVTYWKVTIEDGRKEFEVSIDARTKEVLTTERDD